MHSASFGHTTKSMVLPPPVHGLTLGKAFAYLPKLKSGRTGASRRPRYVSKSVSGVSSCVSTIALLTKNKPIRNPKEHRHHALWRCDGCVSHTMCMISCGGGLNSVACSAKQQPRTCVHNDVRHNCIAVSLDVTRLNDDNLVHCS